MKYYFRVVLVIICCSLIIAAKYPPKYRFVIYGLNKEAKTNVNNRLTEFLSHPFKQEISTELLAEQVKIALMPYGYFDPTISMTLPQKNRIIRIYVKPGPRLIIKKLSVHISGPGRDNYEIKQAYCSMPIRQGDGFNSIVYEEAKSKLVNAAGHQGYLNSTYEKASVFIDKQNNVAFITLHFDTGARSYFGPVNFTTGEPTPTPPVKDMPKFPRISTLIKALSLEGNADGLFNAKKITLSDELLERFIPFKLGCPYISEDIIKLSSNLQSSGYFKSVNATPKHEDPGPVPVDVYLDPVERFRYTISGGYGTDTGVRGRLGLHVIPVNAKGHKLDFVGQGSSYQNLAQVNYIIPGQDPVHDKYKFNGGFTNLNYVIGNSRAGNLSASYEHLTAKFQQIISINALHEDFHYARYPKNQSTVLYPKATFTWRKVSNPLFSPSGFNLTINGLGASKVLLSKLNLAEFMLDIKAALTINCIRTRLYAHVMQGLTATKNIQDVPLSLTQLLGGPENMKGYSFNSIGLGRVLSYGGIEIQKETIDTWYLVGFIDSGTVYNPDPRLVQYDFGIGLMWSSPVGIIKAAIAHPTDSHLSPLKDKGIRFVINMGPDL